MKRNRPSVAELRRAGDYPSDRVGVGLGRRLG